MTAVGDLFAALAAIPALPGANCRGKHDLFDLRDVNDADRDDAEAHALSLCRQCEALAGCSRWFDSLPPRQRPTGVIAGPIHRPQAVS
jgi:hypothetical protein